MAVMLLSAAGCSAMTERKSTSVTDANKVALVNAAARQRGVEVIWVNLPQKSAETAGKTKSVAKN
ncbi:MAG TPA: hypothetical protein VFV64_08060 [Permianibacter sp.]|nr:hypothetical protein [Permianibacter sp.]